MHWPLGNSTKNLLAGAGPLAFDPAMLRTLKLSHFRCFESLRLEFETGVSAFIGANAQGKTSILEAVCVLLRLQSPRSSSLNDLIKFEQTGFGLAGTWEDHELSLVNEQRRRRKLYHHGEEISKSRDYLALSGLVVWMGNDDLQLVTGGGSGRRRYLDFLASQLQVGYGTTLRAYDHALRSRNQLLKDGQRLDWAAIDAYTKVLVEHGNRLTNDRQTLVERLNPHIHRAQQTISGTNETLTIVHLLGSGEDLAATMDANRERDARRGQTNAGPHRDDLQILINGRPASKFASEGQQRTIALALKLAQIEILRESRGITPVLLIDDVFGELDPSRRQALTKALPEDGQKLITTTSLEWLPDHKDLKPVVYRVENGTVKVTG